MATAQLQGSALAWCIEYVTTNAELSGDTKLKFMTAVTPMLQGRPLPPRLVVSPPRDPGPSPQKGAIHRK